MNQSSVAFTSAPRGVADARGSDGGGLDAGGPNAGGLDERGPAERGLDVGGLEGLSSLGELGHRFDEVVRGIAAEDAVVAASDARRARLVASAAALADRMARLDGSAATATGREWARRKLATEIACATHRSERAVTILIDDSEHLIHHLPATLTALETGTISYRHAQAMITHACTLPEESRGAFERDVLPHAEALPAHRFDDTARRHREHTHPESIVVRTKAARAARYVAFQPDCDGMATLYHHLPVIDALAIDDLIDKIARATRTTTNPDPDPDGDPDRRTHAQRRSDALTDLVLGRADRPRITPTILITAPAATIAGTSDQPGQLHGYGPIDPETTRTIAATAPTFLRALLSPETGAPTTITRHRHRPTTGPGPVQQANFGPRRAGQTSPERRPARDASPSQHVGPDSYSPAPDPVRQSAPSTAGPAPTPQGRDRYTPSPTLRTALTLLDETCRFPGCGRRANRCELDHTKAWAEGGTTTPDNLAHLCPKHHHLKHQGGWTVTPTRDGTRTLTWTSPRGAHYTTTPDPPPP